ncbi:MAG: MFS transporter [Pseudomonadota bacterium]|nr:MFS transporter [Pseudomonadota bacterium]
MIKALAPVAALLFSMAMLLMGNGLQSTLLPMRAQIENFGSVAIGVLGSAYFVGFALGCWRGAIVVRQAGHIRAFTAVVAIASTSALVHALIRDPVVWWIVRLISGICIAILFMVIESWLNEKATNETRGTVFSVYTAINLTMVAGGQVILAFGEPGGFPLFLLASILISWAAVPLALSRTETPAPIEHVGIRIGYLLRLSPVGFVGSFAVGVANGSFWALAPVAVQGEGRDASFAAIFIAVSVIAGAVGQYPLGKASDRTDRRRIIIAASLLAAVTGLCLALFGGVSREVMLILGFGFGMFAFPLYSLCVAHANDFVEGKSFVEAASGLLLTWAAGAVVGPVIASAVMTQLGTPGLFYFTTVVQVVFAIFVFIRMRQRQAIPAQTRGTFVEAANAGQTVSQVDPGLSEEPAPLPPELAARQDAAAEAAETDGMPVPAADTEPEDAAPPPETAILDGTEVTSDADTVEGADGKPKPA